MTDELVCWKCGASIQELLQPLARRAQCPSCRADLHVCRLCRFYDPRVSQGCREPIADAVTDKERANFCGYFQPRPDAYRPQDAAATDLARAQLDGLFGGGSSAGANDVDPSSAAERSRRELDALFKK